MIYKLFKGIFTWVIALVVLFEEWGWQPLFKAAKFFVGILQLKSFEAKLATLPPWPALLVLLTPSLCLIPVKLGALWLISHGHVITGVSVIICAKLMGTAIVAWLFTTVKKSIMKLRWVLVSYITWSIWKTRAIYHVRASLPWRVGRVVKRRLKRFIIKEARA